MTSEIMAAHAWPTNGHLVADVAELGYIGDKVLDLTYGLGTFWSQWRPKDLVTNDAATDADHHHDALHPPGAWKDKFDTVVFDPPYKLNGRPDPAADKRYGVHVPATMAERHHLLAEGSKKALHLARKDGTLLVKCMNQVASGRMQWQTDLVDGALSEHPCIKVAEFHMLTKPRSQAHRGPQQHPRSNYSTLLVFKRL